MSSKSTKVLTKTSAAASGIFMGAVTLTCSLAWKNVIQSMVELTFTKYLKTCRDEEKNRECKKIQVYTSLVTAGLMTILLLIAHKN